MKERDVERLEHLISRFLDDEATADERRELRAALAHDPAAAALFDDYCALDREVGTAMRGALGRHAVARPVRFAWPIAARWAGLAAAACLALVAWQGMPRQHGGAPDGQAPKEASSWFAPSQNMGDAWQPTAPTQERPAVHPHEMHREWLIVPGDRPGEFYVIERDRPRTGGAGRQREF